MKSGVGLHLMIVGSIASLLTGCASPPPQESTHHAQAQRGITGVVLDERGLPIPEAIVRGDGRARAKTDERGWFDLPDTVEEARTLSITAEGYAGATYFKVTPGSRLAVGLVHTLTVQVRLTGLGAGSSNGVLVELELTHAWGDPKLSAESGRYGLQSESGGDLEVRPGTYNVKAILGGVRVAERKKLELAPGREPCLVVDCKGIDWATLSKAGDVYDTASSIVREYADKMLQAKKEDRQPIWEEMRSKQASFTEEIRRLQEEFDKSPPARVELRHRVDDF